MPRREIRFEQTHLFIVEGIEERRFWEAFLRRIWGRADIQALDTDGKADINGFLPGLVRAPGFSRVRWLGIAQDADDDAAGAFRRVSGALTRAGLAAPDGAWAIAASKPPHTAVMIWPDGRRSGDLETMLLDALVAAPALACVDDCFSCLARAGTGPQRQLAKARLNAYLASLDPPHLRLGEAMTSGSLSFPPTALARLRSLFP